MPSTTAVIDLDVLVSIERLPTVRLFGREMPVFPLTGAGAHKIAVMQEGDATGAGMLGALMVVIETSVPDLSAAERNRLSVEQMTALIQLSRGAISDVETMLTERAEKN